MKRILLLAAMVLAALAQTGEREIPTFEGDGNEAHDGQPKWCQARDENGFKKNCGVCTHKCTDEHNSPTCKVYCRKSACRCHAECVPTGHLHKMNPLDPGFKAEGAAR